MSLPKSESGLGGPVIRFLIVGGSNTIVTAGIVVLLSLWIPGWMAFTIAFCLGLAYSVLLTGRWVFKAESNVGSSLKFASAYVVIYLIGVAGIAVLGALSAPSWANGATVFLTAPLSFLAGRFIFSRPRPEPLVDTL
jgi:putative flippase GtrA